MGTEDEVIPESMHREVYAAVPAERKRLFEVKAQHNDIFSFQREMQRQLRAWCVGNTTVAAAAAAGTAPVVTVEMFVV
eukprot:NODE_5483_length_578_cov_254.588910.p2 GENE.NODE_5483_length_578_cov_254.588910~~NODE_5483_length_578_cov_254.588910.p2  ORF type:complete len:78 (+),score=37.00 NODE_5483_length_578_cov_254.588910:3-236(+)